MVPELPIAMLTCAKIGAIHLVCPPLCISYNPLDSEFLWCHITNEVLGDFVRYNDLDKNMVGTSKALVQRSFKKPMKRLALRKNLGRRLTHVTTKIRSSNKSILQGAHDRDNTS